MSQHPLYIVDAFTTTRFQGNPAAVCPLPGWLDAATMQAIAAENNLAETVFIVPVASGAYEIRWFTPKVEVDLCGHATLAAAHVLKRHRGFEDEVVRFESRRAGTLPVRFSGDRYILDFPARPAMPTETPMALVRGLKRAPAEVYKSRDFLAVFDREVEVSSLTPDFAELAGLDCLGIIVTAPGSNGTDFVSRFFAPRAGIDEDPVTGSAHCTLAPFWAERLGKTSLVARQISPRTGALMCEVAGERVMIGGHAVTYLVGEIEV